MITARKAKTNTDMTIALKKREESFVQVLDLTLKQIEKEIGRSIDEGYYGLIYKFNFEEMKNDITKHFSIELSSNQVGTYIHLLVDEVIEALRSAGFKLTPSDRCIDTMAFDISWKNISKE